MWHDVVDRTEFRWIISSERSAGEMSCQTFGTQALCLQTAEHKRGRVSYCWAVMYATCAAGSLVMACESWSGSLLRVHIAHRSDGGAGCRGEMNVLLLI